MFTYPYRPLHHYPYPCICVVQGARHRGGVPLKEGVGRSIVVMELGQGEIWRWEATTTQITAASMWSSKICFEKVSLYLRPFLYNNVCIYSTFFLSDTNCRTFSLTTHQSGDPAFRQFITFKTSPPTVNLYFPLSFHNLSRCLNFSSCPHLVQGRFPLRTQANSSSPSKHLQQPQSCAPDRQWKQDTRNKRGSAGSTEILLNSAN